MFKALNNGSTGSFYILFLPFGFFLDSSDYYSEVYSLFDELFPLPLSSPSPLPELDEPFSEPEPFSDPEPSPEFELLFDPELFD